MNKLNCISFKDRYSQAMIRLINLILLVVRHFGFLERPLIVKCYSLLINRSSNIQELVPPPTSRYTNSGERKNAQSEQCLRNDTLLHRRIARWMKTYGDNATVAIKSWCPPPTTLHATPTQARTVFNGDGIALGLRTSEQCLRNGTLRPATT
jgi:hypothetical protein